MSGCKSAWAVLAVALAWAVAVGVPTGVIVFVTTYRPETALDEQGGVIHLKGKTGPDWPLAVIGGCALGTAAGVAGAVWRTTKPRA